MEYLAQGILPTDRTLAHQLRKLAIRYFLHNGILFKNGYNGDPLRCLGPRKVREIHSGDCGSHLGKRRLYRQLLQLGYYWPTMKKDSEELVKTCYACQVLGDAIHTHPNMLQDMTTPWPFHTWELDLIGPINPPSNGHIWTLAAIEYFTKWVKAVPLKKATRAAMANFIREHIITRFRILKRLISDNGTPFINKDMRNLTEIHAILPTRKWPGRGHQQGDTKDSQENETWVWGEIECLLDKCTLGMQELLEDSHGIFTIFPNLWDKSHQPHGASHPYTKSSAWRNPRRHKWHK